MSEPDIFCRESGPSVNRGVGKWVLPAGCVTTYSLRRAIVGGTRAARSLGIHAASTTARVMTMATST